MDILVYPTYFPSISQFAAIAQAESVTFEVEDNFQKQTNRNRMYIYSPNGRQLLNIPVKHSSSAHQKTKDIRIEKAFDWQKLHFKSLEAAYRSSPFFEYYEDEIAPIYFKKQQFLMDLNFEALEIVYKCLGLLFDPKKTEEYFHEVPDLVDFRHLANGKKDDRQFEEYTQVFGDKYGYLNNLSILDLLFNEGRYALDYLKRQQV
ncbi:WbqC family protein [Flavobacterium sp. MAH-1]|uniref:WbqC family protein n=1 Tax=Flavobacterium agri TaxID=2743471 RepID=A0A7Y8Y217_9FLAO|nr:WbqC family protein [Flavobacterium agri]NUY81007.1 WbqC family protein [Flavobacterium agri]NYA71031.1 WbqC family protein [Flavobacterium agri]